MINLYGSLGKKFEKKFKTSSKNIKINVHSVAEMIQAMEANFRGFKSLINKKSRYNISRGNDLEMSRTIPQQEMAICFDEEFWNVLPVAMGCKDGLTQTIIGGLLIIAGIATSMIPGLEGVGGFMVKAGIATALGGVAQMLSATPSTDYGATESADENASYLFTGPTNSVGIGSAIPVIYGECWVGSTTVSGGMRVEDE